MHTRPISGIPLSLAEVCAQPSAVLVCSAVNMYSESCFLFLPFVRTGSLLVYIEKINVGSIKEIGLGGGEEGFV